MAHQVPAEIRQSLGSGQGRRPLAQVPAPGPVRWAAARKTDRRGRGGGQLEMDRRVPCVGRLEMDHPGQALGQQMDRRVPGADHLEMDRLGREMGQPGQAHWGAVLETDHLGLGQSAGLEMDHLDPATLGLGLPEGRPDLCPGKRSDEDQAQGSAQASLLARRLLEMARAAQQLALALDRAVEIDSQSVSSSCGH